MLLRRGVACSRMLHGRIECKCIVDMESELFMADNTEVSLVNKNTIMPFCMGNDFRELNLMGGET